VWKGQRASGLSQLKRRDYERRKATGWRGGKKPNEEEEASNAVKKSGAKKYQVERRMFHATAGE